jgi:predicted nucleic acid-binding protein
MKLDYLIDTNILISLFNQELVQPIPSGDIGYSIITMIEVLSLKGLSSEAEVLIRSSLEYLVQVSLNAVIVEKTIQLRKQYRVKVPDAIIVASAWDCKAVLITNDRQLSKISQVETLSLG